MTQAATLRAEWGARLQSIREEQRLSRPTLARSAGVDPSTIWRIETGEIGTDDGTRMAIAAALGVRVEDIWTYPDTERTAL